MRSAHSSLVFALSAQWKKSVIQDEGVQELQRIFLPSHGKRFFL
jgi:hypothetical protein